MKKRRYLVLWLELKGANYQIIEVKRHLKSKLKELQRTKPKEMSGNSQKNEV